MGTIKKASKWLIGVILVTLLLAQPAGACLMCDYLDFGWLNGGLFICLFTEVGRQQCYAGDTYCSTWGPCTVQWA